MKIAVIADVHGKYATLQKIVEEVREVGVNLVVAPGDFTDMFESVHDFSQIEIADMVVQKLIATNTKVLCVPGNHDPYEIVDVFQDYGVSLHNKVKKVGKVSFIGWGGAETPFNTTFEPTEEETKEALGKLLKKVKGSFVLVTHAPPKGTMFDIISGNKHVGSAAVKNVIKERKPMLALSAHIHENKGTAKIGPTTVFYPGPAYAGFYGIVTIGPDGVECHTKKISP